MSKFLSQDGALYLVQKVLNLLTRKVDKVDGKQLSTNDFTSAEKTKLAGIADGANKYTHPSGSGNKHIPAGGAVGEVLRNNADGTAVWSPEKDTTYSDMVGASASADGQPGLVPAPIKGDTGRYLRADGTWVVPPDTNTTYGVATSTADGLMPKADFAKLAAFSNASAYALKSDITSVYLYKGSKSSLSALPTTGNAVGDMWNVEDTGMNYGWTGTVWDAMGSVMQIDAITNAEIDAMFAQ